MSTRAQGKLAKEAWVEILMFIVVTCAVVLGNLISASNIGVAVGYQTQLAVQEMTRQASEFTESGQSTLELSRQRAAH